MRRVLIGFCIAVLASSQASAANWILVATAANGKQIYLDASNVRAEGNTRTTWEKWIGQNSNGGYTVEHNRYGCDRRTFTSLSWVTYRSDESISDSYQVPEYEQQSQDVVPDTIGEKLLGLVCR